jgi:hypothetical protein
MSDFQRLKLVILDLVDLSKDAAHMHVGLLVFVGVLLLLRGRRSPWLAWLAAAGVAVGLEALDLRDDVRSLGRPRWGASLHDVVNTLVWPTVLAVLVRLRPGWRGAGRSGGAGG